MEQDKLQFRIQENITNVYASNGESGITSQRNIFIGV